MVLLHGGCLRPILAYMHICKIILQREVQDAYACDACLCTATLEENLQRETLNAFAWLARLCTSIHEDKLQKKMWGLVLLFHAGVRLGWIIFSWTFRLMQCPGACPTGKGEAPGHSAMKIPANVNQKTHCLCSSRSGCRFRPAIDARIFSLCSSDSGPRRPTPPARRGRAPPRGSMPLISASPAAPPRQPWHTGHGSSLCKELTPLQLKAQLTFIGLPSF